MNNNLKNKKIQKEHIEIINAYMSDSDALSQYVEYVISIDNKPQLRGWYSIEMPKGFEDQKNIEYLIEYLYKKQDTIINKINLFEQSKLLQYCVNQMCTSESYVFNLYIDDFQANDFTEHDITLLRNDLKRLNIPLDYCECVATLSGIDKSNDLKIVSCWQALILLFNFEV